VALSAGTRLGPYEIQAPIGAGGMGEVYRARDTRLERTVAIKVLPAHLSSNPDLKQRFEREARTISSLNHPHICTLHDIGHQDGTDYLVMEHLEGETLAQRLQKGPLPTEQLLRYAIQITDALDKAHRQGVTHRDLKPANIMLTKTGAKLLDFGLAKLRPAGPVVDVGATISELPTEDRKLTVEGTILGTFQYMSPEQLEGKEADARTDIFAFGAVLYEMATGRPAFQGRSKASLITAIMSVEPAPISQLQPMTPPALGRVIETCLAKDPDQRWQTAHDLLLQLKWIAEAGSQAGMPAPVVARRRSRERLGWIVAVLLLIPLIAAVALSLVHLRETRAPARAIRFLLNVPEKTFFDWYDVPVVSPDGQYVAFTGSGGPGRLWVRSLDSVAAQALPGTEGAYLPFWSLDSRSIAFFSQDKLKRISLAGGPPQVLCDAPSAFGGTWSREGTIVFGSGRAGVPLLSVPAEGGKAKPLTSLDQSREETAHSWPSFLPDGRRLLYLTLSGRPESRGIYVFWLDSKETKRIADLDVSAVYAPPGFLLWQQGEMLMARRFDLGKLQFAGEPFPVAEKVLPLVTVSGGTFSVSDNAVLVYRMAGAQINHLAWFDREGKRLGVVGEPDDYSMPSLSPDQKWLAVCRRDPQKRTRDIWVFDLARGAGSRFTFDPADDFNPVWSPDGRRIVFTSGRKGQRDIFQKAASGIGNDEGVLESEQSKNANDWSSDGRYLIYDTAGKSDLWVLPMVGDQMPAPFAQSEFDEREAQFSPDGKWLAYVSDEAGRHEVYVRTFPEPLGKWQISSGGGREPQWRRDGKELFFISGQKLMAAEVKSGSSNFEAGIPKVLFDLGASQPVGRNRYVVTRDGQRFLMVAPIEEQNALPFTVVVNWAAGLRK